MRALPASIDVYALCANCGLAHREDAVGDAAGDEGAVADRDDPLVVTLPAYWDPGPRWRQARFFAGLDTDWLDLVSLPSVVATATTGGPGGSGQPEQEVVYPERDRLAAGLRPAAIAVHDDGDVAGRGARRRGERRRG